MKTVSFSSRLTELEHKPACSSLSSPNAPLNDMDTLYDIHDRKDLYASMGSALSMLPAFHNDSLKLYCGVPIKSLLPEIELSHNEYLDFVICRGENAVMAVKLMRLAPEHFKQEEARLQASFLAAGLPPDFVQFFYYDDSRQDPVWYAQNIIAFNMGQCFQSDGPCVKTSLCPIPLDLLKQLSTPSLRVLAKEKVGNRKYWFPTEYSRSLGILQGFRTDKDGKVHPLLCCTKEAIDDLRQTVSWGEQDIINAGEKSSFVQRIDTIDQGMTRNLPVLMDMIQHFSETPLTEYFKDHPDSLGEIMSGFPGEYDNYQQLATCLAPFPDEAPLGALILPLVVKNNFPFADKPLRSVFYAASMLAHSRYLVWSADKILYDYAPCGPAEKRKWTYKQWLAWAVTELRKCQEDQKRTSDLYDLIYFIAVEPFSLIQQKPKYILKKL